jgi:alanine-glyoxylate transaminase/serine-glyoxylate transaminase/serine-pyruvate transaminase
MSIKLMIPGPVSVSEDVLYEMGAPVRAHYGAQWTAIYKETASLLKRVFKTEGDVHILVGSGTAGVDAAIGSMTLPGDKMIIGKNGFFGERVCHIARDYGLELIEVESPLDRPLDPGLFAKAMDQHPDAGAVAVVHLETSTTVINPVREIASEARERNIPVIVDAVSSLGGMPLDMDDWGIDICVSASQKCLGAPPGLAPVAVSKKAWEIMKSKPNRGHGFYLNLETWQQYVDEWGEWHPFPVTMATNNVLALRVGVRELLSIGVEATIERYISFAIRFREGVRRLGMEPYTSDDKMCPIVTAVYGPAGVPTSEIVHFLLEKHNIKIAGGLGEELKDRVFRVGHMGPKITEEDIDDVLNALSDFLGR